MDAYTFLRKHIPPPPNSSPPHDNDNNNDNQFMPLEISKETLAKLNQLYKMRCYVRNSNIDLNDFNHLLSHRNKPNEFAISKSNAKDFRFTPVRK